MSESEEFQDWRTNVLNCLATSKNGMEFRALEREMMELIGKPPPLDKMGVQSWGDFLYEIKDIFWVGMFPQEVTLGNKARLFLFINPSALRTVPQDVLDVFKLVQGQERPKVKKRSDGTTNQPAKSQVIMVNSELLKGKGKRIGTSTFQFQSTTSLPKPRTAFKPANGIRIGAIGGGGANKRPLMSLTTGGSRSNGYVIPAKRLDNPQSKKPLINPISKRIVLPPPRLAPPNQAEFTKPKLKFTPLVRNILDMAGAGAVNKENENNMVQIQSNLKTTPIPTTTNFADVVDQPRIKPTLNLESALQALKQPLGSTDVTDHKDIARPAGAQTVRMKTTFLIEEEEPLGQEEDELDARPMITASTSSSEDGRHTVTIFHVSKLLKHEVKPETLYSNRSCRCQCRCSQITVKPEIIQLARSKTTETQTQTVPVPISSKNLKQHDEDCKSVSSESIEESRAKVKDWQRRQLHHGHVETDRIVERIKRITIDPDAERYRDNNPRNLPYRPQNTNNGPMPRRIF